MTRPPSTTNPAPSGAPMPMISFRATKILDTAQGKEELDVSFELGKGRVLTLYGPSGAGKTTLLRILSGLTDIASGRVEVDGELWCDRDHDIDIPARKRSIGLVFQDFALFPHLTVKQNLEYALQKGDHKSQVKELISLMELGTLQDKRPAQLSGGQQQRVALARAIARRPKLLLLDEPLSALDDDMRFRLQDYILTAHRHYQLTTILVSHYLPEIFRLSDEVICLDKGKVIKTGNPGDIFLREKTSGKFRIMGEIVDIIASDIVFIVSVLAANDIVKVIATAEEVATLRIGDKVMVASKAFNPVIYKIE
jgi:molybdate transport system ATP-binding protein